LVATPGRCLDFLERGMLFVLFFSHLLIYPHVFLFRYSSGQLIPRSILRSG
jgi:hypothetical protein